MESETNKKRASNLGSAARVKPPAEPPACDVLVVVGGVNDALGLHLSPAERQRVEAW